MGALNGIRIVDLSRVLGGPYCTQMLADHGASVVKVEPPSGDETRGWGPPFLEDTASYFLGLNRNKQAIAIDLSLPRGREVLLKLLEEADVLVENFKYGTMERWGLGYEEVLSAKFPRLVYCKVSGFGETGPLGGLPGYDAVAQAMSGLMSVNGEKGGEPMRMGAPVIDMVTGLNAALGVLLAIHERAASGRGQRVDATLYDSGVSLMHPHLSNYFLSGRSSSPSGNAHPNICPYDSYATGTTPIFLAIGNDAQFAKLAAVLGNPQLSGCPEFKTNSDRLEHAELLRREIEVCTKSLDGAELAYQLMRKGVPCGSVSDTAEVAQHEHTLHREMVVSIGEHYRGVGSPVKLSRSEASYRSAPPKFGADTFAVLEASGFSTAIIKQLVADSVIFAEERD
ncbi:MAG: CoA transferase [Burkholderiaceae bacterium]